MSPAAADDTSAPLDAYAALRVPGFRWYLGANILALLATQMQLVAVGWDIYERTGQSLQLGLVGLVQVVPVILLTLVAGQVVDRFDRRLVIAGALVAMMACSLGLAGISWWQADYRWIYVCLFANGVARAFLQPAKSALLPLIVPRSRFPNAVTWSTSGFQLATIVGPAVGGLLIGVTHAAEVVYLVTAPLTAALVVALPRLHPRPAARSTEQISLSSLLAGVKFVWRTKLVLGAISLDMFAVLLGGATALLPIYAKDILCVGPKGLGWLRAAPGLGALVMSYVLTHRRPFQRAGRSLLFSVAAFGLATVVFGVARWVPLSWAMLFLAGAFDMISVVIRHTLIQLWTPDEMRGRVSAVNGMFIGISNELGEFESGTVAHLFEQPGNIAYGPTMSVVVGGIGTILVVLLVAWRFPEVRRHRRLDDVPPHDAPAHRADAAPE
jgi:MFS family permease